MNNRGFSLVQIIISLGILSGLFVAALKIIQNQTELGKSSSYRFESLVIMDEVKSILSDPASCRETLKNMSAIYDEVSVIKSFDPRDKKSEEAYATYKVNKEVLGQNNLYLQSMVLNGEVKGFSNENGYTSMVMTFSDKEQAGDLVKTVFPVKVVLNELGRIIDCHSRPGIHQEKSSRTLNDPWIKVKNQASEVIGVSFNGGPVTIGQVAGLGQLNVEGGVIIYDSGSPGECDATTAGSLSFQPVKQILSLCRLDGTWQPLHTINNLGKYKQNFTVATSSNEPKVKTTEQSYFVCRLLKADTQAGQCSAAPVNRVLAQPQWELLSQNYRGKVTTCTFECFR